ncbi:dihydrodipicolinate synthase family protein [Lentzea sp. NPDC051208]|uniref:dihydrodipicolinate synthase family protein n=1 Tax=Lentzea sp. NPDC051208 TaxID=3154642 RepID=UPI003437E21C
MTTLGAPSGLIPVLATPFTETGVLDVPSLRSLVEFQLSCGVDGLAVFGMASEGFALTSSERVKILREVRAVAGAQMPIIAGINATSIQTALEQAAAAVEADQLMVLPPYLVKPAPDQVVDFYAEVTEHAQLPVMVQDAPGPTGVAVSVAAITELSHVDGVTSVKVEAPPTPAKVAEVRARTDASFAVLGGQNAQALIEEYDNGAVGTMPACEFADVLRVVLDDYSAGRRAVARAGFARLLPLIHLGIRPGQAWAVHKEVLRRRGVIASAAVRSPARELDAVTGKALTEILDELSLPIWRRP